MTKQSGIYLIQFQVEDTILGVYVGQSSRLDARFANHLSQLRKNKHRSPPVQAYYNKYGEESFSIQVIEYCDEAQLTHREQHWFEYYNLRYKILNTGTMVDSPLRGYTHSNETRQKMSQAKKGKPLSDEHKKKVSEALRGKLQGTSLSPELMQQIRDDKAQGLCYEELHYKYHLANMTLQRIVHRKPPYEK